MNKKLSEMDCSVDGNKQAITQLYDDGMFNLSEFGNLYKELTKDEWDGYQVAGDMINQFMLTHPKLKDGWSQMSADERWIYTEAMHYGIESLIRKGLGYVQQ